MYTLNCVVALRCHQVSAAAAAVVIAVVVVIVVVDARRGVSARCSFSKIFAPGLRLGWCHADRKLINDLYVSEGAGAPVDGSGREYW